MVRWIVTLPVVLLPEAIQDLQLARGWYESQRTGLGDLFAARTADTIDRLSQLPELYGVIWQDVRAAPIRRHPYIIYYKSRSDRVEVLAVLHAWRDPAVWKVRADSGSRADSEGQK